MSPSPAAARPRNVWGRFDPYTLLVLLFSLFTIGPLLQPGYMWDAHDARHSVYFLFEFDRGIQDGILYPRWQPDFAFGYGYPFFNIYGPLASYLGEAFHLLGWDFVAAVKMVFALSVVGSGLAMRAALAESVAYVFVPLVLWGVWATLHRPRLVNIAGLALSYAALMVTSPLVTLLLTLILVFYIAALALARLNDEQPWRQFSRESWLPFLGHMGHVLLPPALGLILGLGLSAFFALPALTENRFVRVDQWYGGRYAWGGDFVEFFQLFSPHWGFGPSVPGPNDDVSFQLGLVPFVLSLFALLSVLHPRLRAALTPPVRRLILFFSILTLIVVFLMLDLSAPLWEVLPLVRLAQFPWRLLALTVVSLAFLSGAAAKGLRPQTAFMDLPTLTLVALLILGSQPYARVQMSERPVSLAGLMQFQQSSDEMTGSTAWVREIPTWSPMADYHIAGKPLTSKVAYGYLYQQPGRIHARTLDLRSDGELVEFYAERPALLTFNTFYYPGWRAYLLDAESNAVIKELPLALRGKLGLMTVRIPAGVGRVLLRFEQTPIRRLGTAVSAASLALLGILLLLSLVFRRPGQAGGKGGQK